MARLVLYFSGRNCPELCRIRFSHRALAREICAVRGKTAGAYATESTFQWTAAVKALTSLLLDTAVRLSLGRSANSQECSAVIEGGDGTPALSLDYALGKEPQWVCDVFGRDKKGEPLVRRLFRRSNPDRKRSGPAAVSLNVAAWDWVEIEVIVGTEKLTSVLELRALAQRIGGRKGSADNHTSDDLPLDPLFSEVSEDLRESSACLAAAWWNEWLADLLFNEVRTGLWSCDIFSSRNLSQRVNRIETDEAFSRVSGSRCSVINAIDRDLAGAHRLGVAEDDRLFHHFLKPSEPIRVALGVPTCSASALFYYLTYVKGYHFDLNVRHVHAVEIARKVLAGDYQKLPDVLVLGSAPAATLIGRGASTGFLPLMLLPCTSEQIVVPNDSTPRVGVLDCGEYLFINDDPSVPAFSFDALIRQGHVRESQVKVLHSEPHETFSRLRQGTSETRAILFFPHYHFNCRLNNCTSIPDPRAERNNEQMVMFVHESFICDSKRAKYLDIAIRDAWLELRANAALLRRVVALMLGDPVYVRMIARSAGLYGIESW